jgi:F-type H+-transporting ATPase subunit alpha
VRGFEDGLLRTVREDHAPILESIRNEKQISDETGAKLKDVVANYAKSFA